MKKNFDNLSMMKKAKTLTRFQKMAVIVFIVTGVISLKLCADEISTAQARVYREKVVTEAKKYVGCPYVYGAIGPDSFDCSGLVYHVAREASGTQLPRTAKELYSYVRIVPDSAKEPGDLVFFKTTSSGSISHVGIYIGNDQFISAVSDGPNTGVILSSLNEGYWKPRYVAAGQFLKSGRFEDEPKSSTKSAGKTSAKSSAKSNSNSNSKTGEDGFVEEPATKGVKVSTSSYHDEEDSFAESLVFDVSVYGDWSLFMSNSFMINFKGTDIQSNVRVSKWFLEPGFGFSLRYNFGLGVFQLPLMFSMTINDFLKFYAGPVFTFGQAAIRESEKDVNPSIFPGLIGVSFCVPSFLKGDVKLQIVQDISYSVNNSLDGAALPFWESISTGFVFFTGLKVTFPMKAFLKE